LEGMARLSGGNNPPRLEREERFNFSFSDTPIPADAESASAITVYHSNSKNTIFEFDAASGQYRVSQFDAPMTDTNNNETLTVANILVLRAAFSNADNQGRLAIALVGRGDGYFFHGGRQIPIIWTRENEHAPFIYYLDDDAPLHFGVGRTYINIIRQNARVVVE